MKGQGKVTCYEDFKYVLEDVGTVCLGAGFSYRELLLHEMVPFKLKAILERYILTEVSPDTTLESQFYYLEENTFVYETYSQLKVKIKAQIQTEKKSLAGRKKIIYQERVFTLKELAGTNLAKKKASGMLVREIVISKLGLLTFSV